VGVDGTVAAGSSAASSSAGWPCCGLSVAEGVSVGGAALGADGAQAVVKLVSRRTANMKAVKHHLRFLMTTSHKP
jgi:hypothetical protein